MKAGEVAWVRLDEFQPLYHKEIDKGIYFWNEDQNKIMDQSTNFKLFEQGATNFVIDTGSVPYVVDLKTGENIWNYDAFQGEPVKIETVKYHVPCLEEKKITI